MNRLLSTIFIYFFSSSCLAFPLCGPYAGLQLGETTNHYSLSMVGLNSGTVHYEGFSGRAYAGYQLNPHIGIEAGFLRFNHATVRKINNMINYNGRINDYSVDLMIAGNLAFDNGYYIFGKFGAAYHFAQPSKSIRVVSTNDYQDKNVSHYRPVASLGVGYALTRHLGLDASFTDVFEHRTMPNGTLWALGLVYYNFI